MAENKIVTLEVNSNLGETTSKVLNLKQQLKEAKKEVLAMSEEFGVTSEQATRAASRAGELSHEISAANKLVKSFNPANSLQSTTAALGGVKEGFEVVGNTMKVVGVESHSLESAISKVGIAMELSQGISAIQESASAFKTFAAFVQSFTLVQKISTAAQWLWNAAMSANPLGAIVLVIAAVIAAGYKLISFFMESAEANETAMAATKKNAAALKEHEKQVKASNEALKENNDKQYALAKASGASAEELRKLALKHADETIALNKKNTMLARSTFLREADTLATLKANDASDEVIAAQDALVKKSYESFDKQREGLYASYKDKRKVITENEVEVAQEATDRRKKAADDAKKHYDELLEKQKEAAKKAAEERKKSIQEEKDLEKKYNDDLQNLNAKNEEEKIDLQAQRDLIEINRIAKTANDKANLMALYNEKYNLLYQELDDKNKSEKLAKDSKYELDLANNQNLSFEARLQAISDREALEKDIIFKSQEEKTIFEKENTDARIAIAKAEKDAKQAIQSATLDTISGGINLMKQLGEKNKAIQKAAIIAENAVGIARIIINTQAANAKSVAASPLTGGMPWVAINTVMGAMNVASSLLATKKALSELGGGSAGAAPSMSGGGGGASAPAAPSFNVVGNSGVNQIAGVMQQQGAPVVKTYVTAGDVTTAQGLNRNIVSNATLG